MRQALAPSLVLIQGRISHVHALPCITCRFSWRLQEIDRGVRDHSPKSAAGSRVAALDIYEGSRNCRVSQASLTKTPSEQYAGCRNSRKAPGHEVGQPRVPWTHHSVSDRAWTGQAQAYEQNRAGAGVHPALFIATCAHAEVLPDQLPSLMLYFKLNKSFGRSNGKPVCAQSIRAQNLQRSSAKVMMFC